VIGIGRCHGRGRGLWGGKLVMMMREGLFLGGFWGDGCDVLLMLLFAMMIWECRDCWLMPMVDRADGLMEVWKENGD
jgi:hypothetical protein